MNNTFKKEPWYHLDAKQVMEQLEVSMDDGLLEEEAKARLEQYGPNQLPEPDKESLIFKFFKQFHDVLIYVLLVAGAITAVLGHFIDTAVIVAVAVVNACIGFFQENKAENALESIKKMLSLSASVRRSGERIEVNSELLVKGDVVLLKSGDKIPADLRLVRAVNLKVDEAILTGESTSVEKSTEKLAADTVLGDRVNMLYSGTSVVSGTGIGIVVETGKHTEIGKINRSVSEVEEITTPLIKQTSSFGRWVSLIIVIIALIMFVFGYMFRDYETGELLLSVIGLAVAAIPEGLPAILSIILAMGVQTMARKNAIVRNLPSVETLGAVSVICSDKTGTLTKNEMTVTSMVTAKGKYHVSGSGYSPEGDILLNEERVDVEEHVALKAFLVSVKTCNDAGLSKDEDNQWLIQGDPTEGSLLTLVKKSGLAMKDLEVESKIPFDSDYKYMATLARHNGAKVIYIKGAPDRLFDVADQQLGADGEEPFARDYWEDQMLKQAKKGERVIGAAYKIVPENKTSIGHEDLQTDIVFLGLAGIVDPPREEAIKAIEECAKAGILVKMITGDHAQTAIAIGKQMGIGNAEGAIEGKELDRMSDEELKQAVLKYDIFARTSPENKLKLVKALQENGKICAMTGDGVNDAPALKRANVGVAMGIKGTEVAKDASEMILVDDNFKTIVDAVEEGRRVYENLKKTILFILPTNGAESFLIIASILFGTLLPLTPVQILWVNMVSSVTVSFALAFERMEQGTMTRPPRDPNSPLLSKYYIFRIIFVSVLLGGGTLAIAVALINRGFDQAMVNTITLQTIVLTQWFHLFNCRSERDFAFGKGFFSNKSIYVVTALMIILQFSITYSPWMNNVFGTAPLSLSHWAIPVLLGLAVFIIIEIEKRITKSIRHRMA